MQVSYKGLIRGNLDNISFNSTEIKHTVLEINLPVMGEKQLVEQSWND
jgi:hypothetical protein